MSHQAEQIRPIIADLPGVPPPDDMLDDAGYFPEGSSLREPAAAITAALGQVYVTNDAVAITQQAQYARVARRAAVFGAVAIVLAIVQLIFAAELTKLLALLGWAVALVELAFVIVAVWAVARGLWASVHPGWLVARHRAERCRLAKYRFVIDARIWSGVASEREDWERDLRKTADEIARLDEHALEHWMEDDQIESPPSYASLTGRTDVVHALAAYYQQRRLNKQLDYFARRIAADRRQDEATRPWPVILFYLSVGAALIHLALHIGEQLAAAISHSAHGHANHGGPLELINQALLLLALALPAISAAVRTWRSAFEFARNTVRFKAKYMGLRHIADGFEVHTDPIELMRRMWYSEQILEAEHREWLRLMAEAEWFA